MITIDINWDYLQLAVLLWLSVDCYSSSKDSCKEGDNGFMLFFIACCVACLYFSIDVFVGIMK